MTRATFSGPWFWVASELACTGSTRVAGPCVPVFGVTPLFSTGTSSSFTLEQPARARNSARAATRMLLRVMRVLLVRQAFVPLYLSLQERAPVGLAQVAPLPGQARLDLAIKRGRHQ